TGWFRRTSQLEFRDHFAVAILADLLKAEARVERTRDRVLRHIADGHFLDAADRADFIQRLAERHAPVAFALMLAVDHETVDRGNQRLAASLLHVIHQKSDDALARIYGARTRIGIVVRLG